jgi:EgtB-related family protein
VRLPACVWPQGQAREGFQFDNEIGPQATELGAAEIDLRVLSWAEFLPFVEAGGYGKQDFWTAPGWDYSQAQGRHAPRYLRQQRGSEWQVQRWGRWQTLDPAEPAVHLSAYEAQAWCVWAGRRLPCEAEWERAASQLGAQFHWGKVWEWTASDFQPYGALAAFKPHPYRDYSAPWFGQRRVLRGASLFTQPRMRHSLYRNFFAPDRNDIAAGFRTCSLEATWT